MKEGIRFSVIIPAFNAEATIVASVTSCLAQSYPPEEIIVIDDGSTDGTAALLEAQFGSRIRLLRLEKNSGPSAARNAGMAVATGSHFAFQDADDAWHPEKLKLIEEALRKHEKIRFLFHPYTLARLDATVDPTGLVPRRYPFWKLLLSNPIGTPCVVLGRGAARAFDKRLRYMEDYELFLRIAYDHSVYRLPAPLTRLGRPILSSGGQSGARWRMRLGEIRAWRHFSVRRPIFLPLLPLLIVFALGKHVVKSFFPPRTNY